MHPKANNFHSREGEIFRQNLLDSGGVGSIATLKISPVESTAWCLGFLFRNTLQALDHRSRTTLAHSPPSRRIIALSRSHRSTGNDLRCVVIAHKFRTIRRRTDTFYMSCGATRGVAPFLSGAVVIMRLGRELFYMRGSDYKSISRER